jgi:aminoglycoside phosphotransferase (APT) family kinase protein
VLSALYGRVRIAIPKPLYLGRLSDGRAVLGESLVPGVSFSQKAYEALSQPEKDAVFEQLGDIFCQIHHADIPPLDGVPTHTPEDNIAYFHEYYKEAVKEGFTEKEKARIESIYDDFCAAVAADPVPTALCHGDVHFANLCFDPQSKSICGLLDFSIAEYNDPLNDMRYFWNDTTAKMLAAYTGGIGKNVGARHLFYGLSNLIEEAYYERANGGTFYFNAQIKKLIGQEPLRMRL